VLRILANNFTLAAKNLLILRHGQFPFKWSDSEISQWKVFSFLYRHILERCLAYIEALYMIKYADRHVQMHLFDAAIPLISGISSKSEKYQKNLNWFTNLFFNNHIFLLLLKIMNCARFINRVRKQKINSQDTWGRRTKSKSVMDWDGSE
jgi:hypothetical protein